MEENKKTFLEILSSATPIEINELIEERGKERKAIPLIIYID